MNAKYTLIEVIGAVALAVISPAEWHALLKEVAEDKIGGYTSSDQPTDQGTELDVVDEADTSSKSG